MNLRNTSSLNTSSHVPAVCACVCTYVCMSYGTGHCKGLKTRIDPVAVNTFSGQMIVLKYHLSLKMKNENKASWRRG